MSPYTHRISNSSQLSSTIFNWNCPKNAETTLKCTLSEPVSVIWFVEHFERLNAPVGILTMEEEEERSVNKTYPDQWERQQPWCCSSRATTSHRWQSAARTPPPHSRTEAARWSRCSWPDSNLDTSRQLKLRRIIPLIKTYFLSNLFTYKNTIFGDNW